MKTFEFSQPTMMSVNAQAIWNEEKGYWEVTVVQTDCGIAYPEEKYCVSQSVETVCVNDCDEAVIADALLHLNGLDVETIFELPKGSIIKGEE